MTRPKLATGLPVVRLVLARGGATWRWVTVAKRALQNGQRDSMSAHWSMQLGQKLHTKINGERAAENGKLPPG